MATYAWPQCEQTAPDRKAFPLYTDNPEILSQCDLL